MIIYQAIRNVLLALLVCHKYGLRYNPFCGVHIGKYDYVKKSVKTNPFNKDFKSIFFHEIGHHVHHKIVNYKTFFQISNIATRELTYKGGDDFYKVLESEAFASRFAMKTGRANKSYLLWAFNTYANMPFKPQLELVFQPYFTKYVDCVSKNTFRIANH
jgi:hypothetical protein